MKVSYLPLEVRDFYNAHVFARVSVWAHVDECTCVSKSLCVSMHCVFPGTGGQKQKPFVSEESKVIG